VEQEPEFRPLLDLSVNSDQSSNLSNHLLSVDIALERVSLKVGEATLLSDVSVELKSGQLNAIFGPSGAGKSTIMKVLSGQHIPTQGHILVNGNKITDMTPYRSLIGYVPQGKNVNSNTV
jgi:ABC-type bacteriocin/lantibiotic exporter with double-glycine peptidase domain